LVKKGTEVEHSAEIARRYLSWRVVDNTRDLFEQALREQRRWQISYWDALIIAAAKQAGVSTVWSEDLSEGQDYGGIQIVNPLKPSG
jgi:predicted nucleic acid-binding protein